MPCCSKRANYFELRRTILRTICLPGYYLDKYMFSTDLDYCAIDTTPGPILSITDESRSLERVLVWPFCVFKVNQVKPSKKLVFCASNTSIGIVRTNSKRYLLTSKEETKRNIVTLIMGIIPRTDTAF